MIFWVDEFGSYSVQSEDNTKELMEDSIYSQVGSDSNDATSNDIVLVDDPDPLADASSVALAFSSPFGSVSSTYYPKVNVPFSVGEIPFVGVQFKIFVDGISGTDGKGWHCTIRNVANERIFGFYIRPTGALAFYDDTATVQFNSPTPLITNDSWHLVEFTATRTGTSLNTLPGAVDLIMKINNVEIFNDTIVMDSVVDDFAMLSWHISRHTAGGGGKTYIKDFILYDDTGSYNTDFLGPVYIMRRTVNSDADLQWTPSTGSTGYNLLNEAGPSDATYIGASSTLPLPSYFGLEDLPADAVSVRAIMLYGRMRKEDAGSGTVRMSLKDGATPTNGNDREITTAFRYWSDVLEVNANTATAWTPTEFNSATFKIDRTS
jgi:hypothetical protein